MSQAAVEKALGKLITDECFRRRFFKEPEAASLAAGLELSQAELDALSRLPDKTIARFSGCLDDRIRRLPLDEEGQRSFPGAPRARRRRTDARAGESRPSAQETQADEP